jgi:predicted GH43/DUF377 family glycosyl hydrolase
MEKLRWKKLGKIFTPAEHFSMNEYVGFSQSPQALVFEDWVRVYFSIRKKDNDSMFTSHIMFADFDKSFQKIIRVSQQPVIEPGEKGTFDEHGIFPFSPFRYQDKIMAYTCGWSRRVSVPVETATGLAFSEDNGQTFKRYGTGPILGPSLYEPFLVGDSFVQYYQNRFYMWYIYGSRWIPATSDEPVARVYKIAQATSDNGIDWLRDGRTIIEDRLNKDECQALPTVIYFNGRYHMFFCYRYATGFRKDKSRGYRLGYAWSSDLINWQRDDHSGGIHPDTNGWDSDMLCYPNVFKTDDNVYLLYNGNEFGREGFGLALLEQ